jgi:ferredoxin
MSIFLAFLAVAAQSSGADAPLGSAHGASPPESLEEEIVVVGRKLVDWRGQATFMNKRPRCKTIKSTGDAAIDRIGCDAMTYCIVNTRDAFAIRDKGKDKAAASDSPEWRRVMGECVRDQRQVRLRAHVAKRRNG